MKKAIIISLVISFLLQSCFSYKNLNLKEKQLIVGKEYKIMQNGKFVKTKLLTLNDSIANFKIGKDKKDIKVSDIKDVKIRKISIVKTILFTLGFTTAITTIVLANSIGKADYSPKGQWLPQ
jgi:hypothetical protein